MCKEPVRAKPEGKTCKCQDVCLVEEKKKTKAAAQSDFVLPNDARQA